MKITPSKIHTLWVWLALVAVLAPGCDKNKNSNSAADANKLVQQELDKDGLRKVAIDINKDGRYDQYIYYTDDDQMKYAQRDFNFDGFVDMTEFYDGGKHVRDEIDLDYDGICDLIITYENDLPVRKEYAVDFEGNRHGVQYFDANGNRIRIERDTNTDGRPDRIEYYNPNEEEPYKVDQSFSID